MKKVKVAFVLEGKKDPIEEGLLIGDKVLTVADGDYSLHKFDKVDHDGVYIVNLDKNDTDYLAEDGRLLFDLIVKHSNANFQWISA